MDVIPDAQIAQQQQEEEEEEALTLVLQLVLFLPAGQPAAVFRMDHAA